MGVCTSAEKKNLRNENKSTINYINTFSHSDNKVRPYQSNFLSSATTAGGTKLIQSEKEQSKDNSIESPKVNLFHPKKKSGIKFNRTHSRYVSEKEIIVNSELTVGCNNKSPKDQYKIIKKLGKGGYGTVWKVKNIKTGLIRAMKKIPKIKNKRVKTNDIINEIEIMKKLDHPNIVKIYEFFEEQEGYYLITEYCEGGELFNIFQNEGLLKEDIIANIMFQIFSAIYYCHKTNNLIHRDLKPENILIESRDPVSGYYNIKVIDFGTAKLYEREKMESKIIGTIYYIAPEVFNKQYSLKCDIWSCGVILYILLSGKAPFDGEEESEIIDKIKEGKYDLVSKPFNQISSEAKDLIRKCLEKDENKRVSAEGALNHKWFKVLKIKDYFSTINDHFLKKSIQNLISYKPKNKVQELAMTYLIHNFPNIDEIKEINKLFRIFDQKGIGKLTVHQLEKGLAQFMEFESEEKMKIKAKEIFKYLDNDNNGYIEFGEFARATIDKKVFLDKKVLAFIFDFFDKDNSGEISLRELKEAFGMKNLNNEADKLLKKMMEKIDIDGNGQISFKEFQEMMKEIII